MSKENNKATEIEKDVTLSKIEDPPSESPFYSCDENSDLVSTEKVITASSNMSTQNNDVKQNLQSDNISNDSSSSSSSSSSGDGAKVQDDVDACSEYTGWSDGDLFCEDETRTKEDLQRQKQPYPPSDVKLKQNTFGKEDKRFIKNKIKRESIFYVIPPPSEGLKKSLPDIQDRKRILGCLTAILAFYYSNYGEIGKFKEGEVKKRDHYYNRRITENHLDRRYEFFCQLLENCASLLYLDKAHARAFFPMLERVKEPEEDQSEWNSSFFDASTMSVRRPSNNMVNNSFTPKSPASLFQSMYQSQSTNSLLPSKSQASVRPAPFSDLLFPELIHPFLHSLTPGAGLPCISLLLSNYLLRSKQGYDARTRHIFKKLAVLILQHEHEIDAQSAINKYQGLEVFVAQKLLEHHETNPPDTAQINNPSATNGAARRGKNKRREAIMRGLKITSAGVVAGTLFAVTGGLAAPGIAAGVAAVVGSGLVAFTTAASISVLFGVGGGGLAAYKIHRRTKGLTEFQFQKETSRGNLHCVICLSGWLRDIQDFQRPWGVAPRKPPLSEKEKIERFYAKVNPDHLEKSSKVVSAWKGEEKQLYEVLKSKYGVTPDNLWEGERAEYFLENDEESTVVQVLELLGIKIRPKTIKEIRKEKSTTATRDFSKQSEGEEHSSSSSSLSDLSEFSKEMLATSPNKQSSNTTLGNKTNDSLNSITTLGSTVGKKASSSTSKVVRAPWSFQHLYSGELYTIRWESLLLLELCDSVADLAVDFVGSATREILRHTAFSTLMSAVALPIVMINGANMIDGTWTLAIERSEEAGIELANILLSKEAGHRPVTLIGYSMGARSIYVCLKELIKLQEQWIAGEREDIREPASVVEDVILMGMPNHLSLRSWMAIRTVVAGRIVNCYSTKDWIIGLMFQYKRMAIGRKVCGTSKVNVPGVENYNVTSLIQSHTDYCDAVPDILKLVQYDVPNDFVVRGKFTQDEEEEEEDSLVGENTDVENLDVAVDATQQESKDDHDKNSVDNELSTDNTKSTALILEKTIKPLSETLENVSDGNFKGQDQSQDGRILMNSSCT